MVPKYLGNLPTGVASAVIGTAASLQAIGVQAIIRALGGGVAYDAARRDPEAGRPRRCMRSWLAVSRWVDDAAPFPGVAFDRWVRDFYQRNELVAGRVRLRGHRIDLTDVQCALLNVSGWWDHIVPPSQTTVRPNSQAFGRDVDHPRRRTCRHPGRPVGNHQPVAAGR